MHSHTTRHVKREHSGSGATNVVTRAIGAAVHQDHSLPVVSVEEIRQCAYQKWERAGKPSGDGAQFWLEAEQELVNGE